MMRVIEKNIKVYGYNLNILYCFFNLIMREQMCVLCGTLVKASAKLNLCDECIGCADCCIGLEKL
jgi:hypothetical protein